MADSQRDTKWYHHVGEGFSTIFRNLSGVRGLTGIVFIGSFLATVFAAWQYSDSVFGKFSQSLGITISSVLVGLWGADYYYRKDAYKKRYRDVEVSVYTTWLLIAGVEAMRQHFANSKTALSAIRPTDDAEHEHKLQAHSQIEAGHTAAELTIGMAFLGIANLESFSKDAVKSGKDKFSVNELEAGTRQQIRDGAKNGAATANHLGADEVPNNENGGASNE
ncbi:hypothetical protein [Mycobacterium sp. AT1]|uniref:hypothetical protein n=1 Tax=Mycobacterium sp. AT1 TaxID=1961706 RepID=UPI00115430BF|nr:hypothetical protein [Mycobacterium sp. AT1]